MPSLSIDAERAAKLIARADAIVIAAGAGIGLDSGLPDFQGLDNFWKAYPAAARADLNFTGVASPKTLLTDPALAWGFFGHSLSLFRKTKPHEGFDILRKWADRAYLGARIFTSNVDGQFQKAGFAENQIQERYGSIHHLQCMKPCNAGVWRSDDFKPLLAEDNCRLLNAPPTCPVCGGPARPNILLYGDTTWLSERRERQRRFEATWFERLVAIEANAVVIEIGAGTAKPYVRHFSERISWKYGARLIRINPLEYQVPSAHDVGIDAGALETLVAIDSLLEK